MVEMCLLHGPDSIGIIAVSHNCSGVAARVCGLVAEILKDRLSWYRDCRNLDVLTVIPTGNGGTIDLIYMQIYAPTTLSTARDFWLIHHYTLVLEDGSLVICERSLDNTQDGLSMPSVRPFVRAEMLLSGYLIRSCDSEGSVIHIVENIDFELWSVPKVLWPLYESSAMFAQKTTIALYAPTTLSAARDFWLIHHYTLVLEDGSLVICERSLDNTQYGLSMPSVQPFVRAEMLLSGYLIRPCDSEGSVIHIVENIDFEPWSVPKVLWPLYESSAMFAQKTTIAVRKYPLPND